MAGDRSFSFSFTPYTRISPDAQTGVSKPTFQLPCEPGERCARLLAQAARTPPAAGTSLAPESWEIGELHHIESPRSVWRALPELFFRTPSGQAVDQHGPSCRFGSLPIARQQSFENVFPLHPHTGM